MGFVGMENDHLPGQTAVYCTPVIKFLNALLGQGYRVGVVPVPGIGLPVQPGTQS
jgi:hypothetical protein